MDKVKPAEWTWYCCLAWHGETAQLTLVTIFGVNTSFDVEWRSFLAVPLFFRRLPLVSHLFACVDREIGSFTSDHKEDSDCDSEFDSDSSLPADGTNATGEESGEGRKEQKEGETALSGTVDAGYKRESLNKKTLVNSGDIWFVHLVTPWRVRILQALREIHEGDQEKSAVKLKVQCKVKLVREGNMIILVQSGHPVEAPVGMCQASEKKNQTPEDFYCLPCFPTKADYFSSGEFRAKGCLTAVLTHVELISISFNRLELPKRQLQAISTALSWRTLWKKKSSFNAPSENWSWCSGLPSRLGLVKLG